MIVPLPNAGGRGAGCQNLWRKLSGLRRSASMSPIALSSLSLVEIRGKGKGTDGREEEDGNAWFIIGCSQLGSRFKLRRHIQIQTTRKANTRPFCHVTYLLTPSNRWPRRRSRRPSIQPWISGLRGYTASSMSWMTDQKGILFLYPSSFVRSHSRYKRGRSSVQQAQVGEDPQNKGSERNH